MTEPRDVNRRRVIALNSVQAISTGIGSYLIFLTSSRHATNLLPNTTKLI